MRKISLLLVVAGALLAWASVGAATAAVTPTVADVVQVCQTEGGVSYITDGVYEDEEDCESSDTDIIDPESSFLGHPVCIGGTTFLYSDDEGDQSRQDFLAAVADLGIPTSDAACPPSAVSDVDSVQVCESPNYSDNLVTLTVDEYTLHKAGLQKPVATAGYIPQGQNSGYAGKLGLKCLGKPAHRPGVGVEVGSGDVLVGPQYDPDFNPGTYGQAA